MKKAWNFVCVLALASGLPAVAQAGGCPTCDSTADCEAMYPGEVTFCVQWDAPVGCGDLTRLCCPGQGCAIEDGRPSCEGDNCTVVEDLASDGGLPERDAGTSTGDAGPVDVDGGPTPDDAGPTPDDAGSTPADAGSTSTDAGPSSADGGATPMTDGGCGCRGAGAPSSSPGWLLLLGTLALVGVRRARRARS
jgi:MYXO-CTERM domain-containing protein